MNDDKNDKMIDNLAKMFVHMTDDTFEKMSKRAVLICFVLKYVIATGVYIALRNLAGLQFGELWIAIVMAFALYGHELYINMKLKEGIVKSILKEESNEKKNIEDSNCTKCNEEEKS